MKKILVILLVLFIASSSYSQNIVKKKIFTVANITVADSMLVEVTSPGQWSVDAIWTGIVGTGAQIDIRLSNTETGQGARIDSGDIPYTMTGAAGKQVFISEKYTTTYMWVKVIKGSTTAGTITVTFNINKFE